MCRGRNSRRNSIGKIEFAFVSVSHTCNSLSATRKLHLWVVMKGKLLGIAAIAALIGTPALAADMPVKAPPAPASSWTGFYVGGEAGYGWEEQAVNQVPNDPAAAMLFSGAIGFAAEQPIPGSYKVDRTGAVGGFEAGYNWQSGPNWVWGLETDFNFSGINGQASGTSVIQGPPAATFLQTTTSQQNTDWYGTVRGRLGYLATPNLLLYGTGGLAYGRVADTANLIVTGPSGALVRVRAGGFSFSCTANVTCFSGTASSVRTGWTTGAGAEWMFNRHWSAKIEYQFVDLGSDTMRVVANTLPVPSTALSSFNATFRDAINVVRVGANYHF